MNNKLPQNYHKTTTKLLLLFGNHIPAYTIPCAWAWGQSSNRDLTHDPVARQLSTVTDRFAHLGDKLLQLSSCFGSNMCSSTVCCCDVSDGSVCLSKWGDKKQNKVSQSVKSKQSKANHDAMDNSHNSKTHTKSTKAKRESQTTQHVCVCVWRHSHTKQNKTKQKQNKTTQNKTKQHNTTQNKTKQHNTTP